MFTLLKKIAALFDAIPSLDEFSFKNMPPDRSGLDGGGWQGWVEIFRPGEGRNHRHIADVQPSVHKEQVPDVGNYLQSILKHVHLETIRPVRDAGIWPA